MKNPLTPAGIEPATFRFVAQHLNHCAAAVPNLFMYWYKRKHLVFVGVNVGSSCIFWASVALKQIHLVFTDVSWFPCSVIIKNYMQCKQHASVLTNLPLARYHTFHTAYILTYVRWYVTVHMKEFVNISRLYFFCRSWRQNTETSGLK